MRSYMRLLKAGMTKEQKIAIIMANPDADLTITFRYWDLFEEHDFETAEKFKQKIHEVRWGLRRRLTIPEVEEIFQKFKNATMNSENTD